MLLTAERIATSWGEWTWNPIYESWMWFLDIQIWQTFEDLPQLWVGF